MVRSDSLDDQLDPINRSAEGQLLAEISCQNAELGDV